MSLFKSRDWWENNLNEFDSYDSQSLLTLKIDTDEYDSIVIGSHKGLLRLFSPSSKLVDGVVSGYEASHLMLEVQLHSPILQINEGLLISEKQEGEIPIDKPEYQGSEIE